MPSNAFDLDGRTALVTGAATGLGRGIALALAEAGADIVAAHHRHDPADLARRVRDLGRRLVALGADLSDAGQARDMFERASQQCGHIDILVNNAGIIRRADLPEFPEQDWHEVMAVNLTTPFLLSQAAARHMIERGRGGKIIHVASMLSYQGGIRVVSYAASKHGVMGLTRAMANELAPHGINVNAIAPGYMATANTQALRDDFKRSAEILGRIPAGRWGEPEDLAGAAVFLASPASDYVHGITIPVDGGWLAR